MRYHIGKSDAGNICETDEYRHKVRKIFNDFASRVFCGWHSLCILFRFLTFIVSGRNQTTESTARYRITSQLSAEGYLTPRFHFHRLDAVHTGTRTINKPRLYFVASRPKITDKRNIRGKERASRAQGRQSEGETSSKEEKTRYDICFRVG
jgi:hypothetical protein